MEEAWYNASFQSVDVSPTTQTFQILMFQSCYHTFYFFFISSAFEFYVSS